MGESNGNPVHIAVQSERRLTGEALCAYLDSLPDFQVVGRTATVEDLRALCVLRHPQLALVDTGLLRVDTARTLCELHAAFPSVEIVVLYADLYPAALQVLRQAGITALVPSGRGLSALLATLRQRYRPVAPQVPDGLALTERELAVVTLLGYGHSAPEIAKLLRISPHTVENHKRRIYAKLGVGNQSHAVSRATLLGLVTPRPTTVDAGRPGGERGRAPLVVVHGPPGPCRDRVLCMAIGSGLPVVVSLTSRPLGHDHWARWQLGPVAVILVDPTAESWMVTAALSAPTVVIYSTRPQMAIVLDALLRGVHALILGDDVPSDLDAILSLVVRGYFAMRAGYVERLLDHMAARLRAPGTGMPDLTAREREVLASIAGGDTVRQTARILGIATKTVENTQARLFRKLGTHNRSETLTIAYELGMVDPAR
jgi:DNA-binding NarL/FixJ family response regulator